MSNNNELYQHKRSDAVKWTVVFLLIAVLFAGMAASLTLILKEDFTPEQTEESEDEIPETMAVSDNEMIKVSADINDTSEKANVSADTIYSMPKTMAFTEKTLMAAQSEGQSVDVKVKAVITPGDADNKEVDYSIAWGSAPTHGSEPVTDYVTVTQDYDGSLTATVSCMKSFDSDRIIITVTTRDGGFTAHCTVSFVGIASEMSVTSSEITPVRDDKRDVYYQLGTNRTYNFDISLGNIFNKVGSKNLTVSVGGSGSLYFGTTFSDSMSGIARFQDIERRNLSDMADRFIKSAEISGTTLTVKTGSALVEEYYSRMEPDEYFTGTYCYDRFVVSDEYGMIDGPEGFEAQAQENINSLPYCCFTVTVTDTVSGLSETLRFWLVSAVSGIKFETPEITF